MDIEDHLRVMEFVASKILGLWNKHKDGNGEAYLPAIYINPKLLNVVQKKQLTGLLHDSLGFGLAKMTRHLFT
jgi:5-methylthioribose kinase